MTRAIGLLRNSAAAGVLGITSGTVTAATRAVAIEQAGGDLFTNINGVMQNVINFMSGPYATFVMVASLLIALGLWIFAPKEGVLGTIFRVIIGGLLMFNIGGVFTFLNTQ